ncbi:MAG TPA: MFS transporter [Candidatus Polarisedimenticolia bacterium]|nr:MFS transporter [Candidatus Polarisedimenticolia bacterium]
MTRQTKFYGWKLLGILWLILFANFAFPMYGASVVNTYMAADLHLDRSQLGLAFGLFQWMAGLPAPLIAICISKRGVRFTMALGCLTVTAGALMMAFVVRTGWQADVVYGVIIAVGALSAGVLPAQTGISRWFMKARGRAITLIHTSIAFGGFVAVPTLDFAIARVHGNWRVGWWLMASLSAVAAMLVLLFVKERPADLGQLPDGRAADDLDASAGAHSETARGVYKTAAEWTFGEAFRTPAMWMLLLATIGFSAGYPLFIAHGVVHLRDLGHTAAAAAFSISIMVGSSLGGTLLFAAVADRIEPRQIMAAASLVFGVGMLLAIKASGPVGLYAYAVCLGSGFGAAFSATMALPANYFGTRAYAPVVGVLMAVGTTAGAAGPIAAGYTFDHYGSYTPAFYVISGLSFAAAVLLLFMRPPAERAGRAFASGEIA